MNISIIIRLVVFMLLFSAFATYTYAQHSEEELFEMSLEELMNIEIVSASKKAESAFDSPLSSSVITREEIYRSGATSIMEALRLSPGVIVREQTNGNYDVHLRGMDYVPSKTQISTSSNNITLVMIDGRIVFRDFQGGTYWESLPVDINDVEKIEIVRGPSSALYGPNAVAGVVNIITRRGAKEGAHVEASASAGNFNTQLANTNLSYNKDDLSIMVTGNLQMRDRYAKEYWDYFRDGYTLRDSIRAVSRGGAYAYSPENAATRYPDPSLSQDKYGVNAFINYSVSEDITFDLSAGLQDSEVQKIYVDNQNTPFTTENSTSKYINLKTSAYGLDVQLSYLNGTQNTLGVSGWELDFTNLNASLEYEFNLLDDKLDIRPGFMFRDVSFDDAKSVESYGNGFIGGEKKINSTGGFVRADYRPIDKLRIIAAVRGEKYNYPDDMYVSYQFGTSYYINENNHIRFVASRANRGANVVDVHIDYSAFGGIFNFKGNQDVELMTMDMYELGYRSKISEGIQLDAELYYAKAKNFNTLVLDSVVANPNPPYIPLTYNSVQNLSVESNQMGATFKLKYLVNRNLEISPNFTVQQTELKNYDEYSTTSLQDSIVNVAHKWTPSVYGGVYINWKVQDKLNINLSPYFYSSQEFRLNDAETDQINGRILMNAAVSYKFYKENEVYVSARNIFSGNERQFAFGDPIQPLILGGIRIDF